LEDVISLYQFFLFCIAGVQKSRSLVVTWLLNLMSVTLLAPRILWWLIDFWIIYAFLFYFILFVWVMDGMGLIATAHMMDLGIWRRHILMLTSNWNVRIQLKTADFSATSMPLNHATYLRKLILVVIAIRTSIFKLELDASVSTCFFGSFLRLMDLTSGNLLEFSVQTTCGMLTPYFATK